jgi:hypothetical protein
MVNSPANPEAVAKKTNPKHSPMIIDYIVIKDAEFWYAWTG